MTAESRTIHVVMAVFKPQFHHISEQIKSLSCQEGTSVIVHAVIADLTSSDVVLECAAIHNVDVRLHVPTARLNSVSAFEFGMTAALREAKDQDLFAFCDQDDVWHSNKLKRSVDVLDRRPECHLVHSDARLVDDTGELMTRSMFEQEGRDKKTDLRKLLYRNSITGMTALFSREVAAHSLPFPRQSGAFFYHDLWVGLIAAAKGPIEFIADQTVDYRQHGSNTIGAITREQDYPFLSKDWLRSRFASYSLASYLAKTLVLRAEEVCLVEPQAFNRSRLRDLRPYLKNYGAGLPFYLDAAKYLARGYMQLADHSVSQGIVKSGRLAWAVKKTLKLDVQNRLKEFDDIGFSLAPGVSPQVGAYNSSETRASGSASKLWYSYVDCRKSMSWSARFISDKKPSCVILVPTLNPTEIFAGVATALQLGIGLAERGEHVRFVATDLPMVSSHASRAFISERISGKIRAETLERIETICGVGAKEIIFSPFDQVFATAWWTAHIAARLISNPSMVTERFHYIIQDFEPNFYAWGSDFAGAVETYSMPCVPIFNTTLLRDFFHGEGFSFGGEMSFSFRPSIDIEQYADLMRAPGRKKKRIALYGRPEVPRNMFPVCVEALSELIHSQGLNSDMVEVVSVGLAHDPIILPGDVTIQSLGKLPMEDYPVFLTTVDLGISLMYSPHPSHLPIEMAASGARVVTNNFGPKDLSRISPLIYSAEPTPSAMAKELVSAWSVLNAPIPRSARYIDLSSLGQSLDEVVDQLVISLSTGKISERVA